MSEENTLKQEHILEAAIKRFAHFGIHKTSIAEVAADLGISKQSFGYYYHDKCTLVASVIEKISNEFLNEIDKLHHSKDSITEIFLNVLEIKIHFIKKYYLMALGFEGKDARVMEPIIKNVLEAGKQRHIRQLSSFIRTGIDRGQLNAVDETETANLLLETFLTMEIALREASPLPDPDEIDRLFERQKKVMKLFLNGLKNQHGEINK